MKQKHQLLLIIAAVLVAFFLASVANAVLTEIERFVDTDTLDAPGDGSVGDPWISMSIAEAALDDNGNLVNDDTFITLHLSGSANDTTGVVWSGFTTDATHYIDLLGDGDYSLVINDGTPINISNVSHIRFDNINLEVSAITGGALSVFRVSNVAAGSDIRITNSILKGPDDAVQAITLVRVEDTDTVLSINNSLLYDGGVSASSRAIWINTNGGSVDAYNCTIADTGLGVVVADNATGVFTGKNTIVSGTSSLAYSVFGDGTLVLTNCTADDATAEQFDTGDGENLVINGDFSSAGGGGTEIFVDWVNTAAVAEGEGDGDDGVEVQDVDPGEFHDDPAATGGACNIWSESGENVQIKQTGILIIGKTYRLTLDMLVNVGSLLVRDASFIAIYAQLTTPGHKTVFFVAVDTGIIFARSPGATNITIDNIEIQLATCTDNVTPNYVNLFEVIEDTWVGKGADISAEAKWFIDDDTDYYGTVRGVRGGWDIGYYEYPVSGTALWYYRALLERN